MLYLFFRSVMKIFLTCPLSFFFLSYLFLYGGWILIITITNFKRKKKSCVSTKKLSVASSVLQNYSRSREGAPLSHAEALQVIVESYEAATWVTQCQLPILSPEPACCWEWPILLSALTECAHAAVQSLHSSTFMAVRNATFCWKTLLSFGSWIHPKLSLWHFL